MYLSPPPHKRIGRAIYILANQLEAWADGISVPKRRRRNVGLEDA